MASSASIDLVQQAYIAYYGRPADQAGLEFWCQELDNNGGDLTAIVDAFANSEEYTEYLGGLALEERLNAIYQNAFNRDGDADGIAFWQESIENGTISAAQASLAILQGGIDAGDPDATVVANKVAVAKDFTTAITGVEYGAEQVADARALIAAVDGTDESVDAAAGAIDTFVDEYKIPGVVPGLNVASEDAAGADSMRLTGDKTVRIDFTDPEDQITGVDLNDNGVIDRDGVENNSPLDIDGFEIVDAYARNPLNQADEQNNFTGDIDFDGTGFAGDGVNTDGNIFLGGLGVDTALGGIGNDFLAGGGVAQGRFVWDPLTNTFLQDTKYGTTGNNIPSTADFLFGGRNADFFFAELSLLDPTDGDNLIIDGGNTTDDRAAGQGNTDVVGQSAQDSDWLLIEASDDDETTVIDLNPAPTFLSAGGEENQFLSTRSGVGITMSEVEHINASGNLYGFLNDIDTTIGGRAGEGHAGDGSSNYGLGSSAQLDIRGSLADNIIIAGYDNDLVDGEEGNDILFGGDLAYIQNNPNAAGVVNNGVDTLIGGTGSDHVVFEL
ncbi:MAG: DUF4214 domain-containing protein, partial [Pseudomonadales bacterium]|nr:DUF4214 domain-containing protein [Pseudomonadales bacterium]